jgi:hypothetical protein
VILDNCSIHHDEELRKELGMSWGCGTANEEIRRLRYVVGIVVECREGCVDSDCHMSRIGRSAEIRRGFFFACSQTYAKGCIIDEENKPRGKITDVTDVTRWGVPETKCTRRYSPLHKFVNTPKKNSPVLPPSAKFVTRDNRLPMTTHSTTGVFRS